ncbi:hypothetical protein [Streptomyces ardesiacus]|uniref:RNA polymerase subunit sigma-70 n=1 Tax=Streptomyces ardesiacus TaxID=285564 RepID=A0ABW8HLD7_9ACTN
MELSQLVEHADRGIPVRPEVAPGDLLRRALGLQDRANRIVEAAVVAERERGTTWDRIGEAAGVTRQSAHERWQDSARSWAAIGRCTIPLNNPRSSLEYASMIDGFYAARHPDEPRAVSQGLDANRFPGSREDEQSLRTPAVAENRDQTAAIRDQRARVYEQLAACEPTLSEEHRADADRRREAAEEARLYATSLRTGCGRAAEGLDDVGGE